MLLDIIRRDFVGPPGFDAGLRKLLAPSFFVDVGSRCNFRCLYCSIERDATFHNKKDIFEVVELGGQHRLGCGFFTGGEPSIYPHLEQVMAHGTKHGVPRYAMTTNAFGLTDPGRVRELDRLGMRLWQISMDDFRPEVLDLLRGHAGVLDLIHQALEVVHTETTGVVTIYAVVARQNHEILPELVEYVANLRKRFPKIVALNISMLKPIADAWRNREVLFPMEEAVLPIREAIEVSKRKQLPIWFNHLPACLIPDLPGYHYSSFEQQGRYETDTATELPNSVQEDRLIKGSACLACTKFEVCNGYWKNYVELFGNEIFRPSGPLVRPEPLPEKLLQESKEAERDAAEQERAELERAELERAKLERDAAERARAARERLRQNLEAFLRALVLPGWQIRRVELEGAAPPFILLSEFVGGDDKEPLQVCLAPAEVDSRAYLRTDELLLWYRNERIDSAGEQLLGKLQAVCGREETRLLGLLAGRIDVG